MVRIQQINQSTKSKRNSNTGGIHQLPSGNWELRWYVTDESGNRKRVSTTVKGSKKNAQAKLREVLSAVDNGSHVDKSKETVKEFSIRWMETYVATTCTIRTEIGYVFTQANGSPVLPGSLTAEFASLVKELELPHLTFHGLRHAFATLGLVAGINPKVVSEALGHSSVTITLDLYSHVLPNMQDELAGAIANFLKR